MHTPAFTAAMVQSRESIPTGTYTTTSRWATPIRNNCNSQNRGETATVYRSCEICCSKYTRPVSYAHAYAMCQQLLRSVLNQDWEQTVLADMPNTYMYYICNTSVKNVHIGMWRWNGIGMYIQLGPEDVSLLERCTSSFQRVVCF